MVYSPKVHCGYPEVHRRSRLFDQRRPIAAYRANEGCFRNLKVLARDHIVQIDIEGLELELFPNADWVRHVQCIMIETHDRFWPRCEAVRVALGERWEQRGETAAFPVSES